MWDIKQIITLKYRQCDKLSISRWSDVNAIFLAVPARKIATSNHLEIDSSSHHRIFRWLFAYYNKITSPRACVLLFRRRKSFIFISCSSDWLYANEFVLGVRNCRGKKNFAARAPERARGRAWKCGAWAVLSVKMGVSGTALRSPRAEPAVGGDERVEIKEILRMMVSETAKSAKKCKMVMLWNGFFGNLWKWYAPERKFRAENGGLSRSTYPLCIHMDSPPPPPDQTSAIYPQGKNMELPCMVTAKDMKEASSNSHIPPLLHLYTPPEWICVSRTVIQNGCWC